LTILPWLQRYSKEILLAATTIIAATVRSRDVISEEQAEALLGEETALEAMTRKLIGKSLVTAGTTIKTTPFIDRDFSDQVGGQMVLIGHLLNQFPVKKEEEG